MGCCPQVGVFTCWATWSDLRRPDIASVPTLVGGRVAPFSLDQAGTVGVIGEPEAGDVIGRRCSVNSRHESLGGVASRVAGGVGVERAVADHDPEVAGEAAGNTRIDGASLRPAGVAGIGARARHGYKSGADEGLGGV